MSTTRAAVSAAVVRQRKDGGWLFGVVGKRTYQVDRGRCRVAAEQLPLVEEPAADGETGQLLRDSDLIITRATADLIVLGHAHTARPQPSFTVGLRVGDFHREIKVFGDRQLQRHATGGLSFSAPAPVQKVALGWEQAYGGIDLVGLNEIGDPFLDLSRETETPLGPHQSLFAYPRNPFGRGYLIEPSPAAIEACRLPNLEYAWSPVTPENIVRHHYVTWPQAPLPAATGWLGYGMFPRSSHLGLPPPLYDDGTILPEHFYEVQTRLLAPVALDPEAGLPARLDVAGMSQGSAMTMRGPVRPGAAVLLTNAHPLQSSWAFTLPGETPRLAYRLPGQRAEELGAEIRCLIIEPDEDRVTVLWSGTRPLDQPLSPNQKEAVEHGVIWS
jgi:hypothetical protein